MISLSETTRPSTLLQFTFRVSKVSLGYRYSGTRSLPYDLDTRNRAHPAKSLLQYLFFKNSAVRGISDICSLKKKQELHKSQCAMISPLFRKMTAHYHSITFADMVKCTASKIT